MRNLHLERDELSAPPSTGTQQWYTNLLRILRVKYYLLTATRFDVDPTGIVMCWTLDKRVLGSTNDFAWQAEALMAERDLRLEGVIDHSQTDLSRNATAKERVSRGDWDRIPVETARS